MIDSHVYTHVLHHLYLFLIELIFPITQKLKYLAGETVINNVKMEHNYYFQIFLR